MQNPSWGQWDPTSHHLWQQKQSCMPVGFWCLGGQLKWSKFWVKSLNTVNVGTCSRRWYGCEFSLAWTEISLKVSFIFPWRARGNKAAGQGSKLSPKLWEWGIPYSFGFANAYCTCKEQTIFLKHLGYTLWCWKIKLRRDFKESFW